MGPFKVGAASGEQTTLSGHLRQSGLAFASVMSDLGARPVTTREFRDEHGIVWTVRQIVRSKGSDGAVRPGLEDGWLLFDCGSAKRRYGPIPDGWQEWDAPALSRLCRDGLPARTAGE